jgi:TonB family protein
MNITKQMNRYAKLLHTGILLLAVSGAAHAQSVSDTIYLEHKLKVVCRTATDKKPAPDFVMTKFLMKNLKYPDDAREESIEGRVYVRFVVNGQGKVTEPEIISSPHTVLSAEVLRLVKLMPDWIPATKDDKPTSAVLEMPLNFKLE